MISSRASSFFPGFLLLFFLTFSFCRAEKESVAVVPFDSGILSSIKMTAFSNYLIAKLSSADFNVIGWDDLSTIIGKPLLWKNDRDMIPSEIKAAAGALNISLFVKGSMLKSENNIPVMHCFFINASDGKRIDSLIVTASDSDPASFTTSVPPLLIDKLNSIFHKKSSSLFRHTKEFTFTSGGILRHSKSASIYVSPFYFQPHMVTQQQYIDIFHGNPSNIPAPESSVNLISWYDAVLYCNEISKINGLDTVYSYSNISGEPGFGSFLTDLSTNWYKRGFRLPTKNEWEYLFNAADDSCSIKKYRSENGEMEEWMTNAVFDSRIRSKVENGPQGDQGTTRLRQIKCVRENYSTPDLVQNPTFKSTAISFRVVLPEW